MSPPARAARIVARTLVAVLVAGLGVSALPSAVAAAVSGPAAPVAIAPSAAPSVAPTAGKQLCSIADERLAEISGLVSTKQGYVAVADGADDGGGQLEVFDLDAKCQVTERHSFSRDPFDPEDLAISKDGTLWVADIGDNDLERDTVALWKIAPDRNSVAIHRLKYPDGAHDAEALLMQPDGKPVIVTKDLDGGGASGIYVANVPLKPDQSVPLTKVGVFTVGSTGTDGNRFGPVGQKLVTGAALSADGTRAVVRTYADAYEWKVSGGNVVAALTKSKPVRTPLPGEPQGEAITYSQDGKTYVTATEATPSDPPRLFSYQPATPAPAKAPGSLKRAEPGWFGSLGLQDIKMIIAGFGVLGLMLVFLGAWGIRRARADARRRKDGDPPDGRRGRGAPDGLDRGHNDAYGSDTVEFRGGPASGGDGPRRGGTGQDGRGRGGAGQDGRGRGGAVQD
ncbi:MAG: hypothetical protein ACRDT4_14850, partial [Micromonosporaceae bacterium]